ncbi:hypothetical protein [Prevotella sp.]|uniref:hypothetical protein n=1 Tax=Prevotella sp. TaxID=59823 RepID=UPI0027E362D2|nr:hypothetical protein [Prevotella sp.]
MGQRDEKDKIKSRKEKLAGYFYDLSKLTFAALVLGGMSSLYTDDFKPYTIYVVIAGLVLTYITAFSANRILKY